MFSRVLPPESRNGANKQFDPKMNKTKKSESRLNSSVLSMYNEQPSYILKSHQKENVGNAGLNSYINIPFMAAQFKTVNNSVLNPEVESKMLSESHK